MYVRVYVHHIIFISSSRLSREKPDKEGEEKKFYFSSTSSDKACYPRNLHVFLGGGVIALREREEFSERTL